VAPSTPSTTNVTALRDGSVQTSPTEVPRSINVVTLRGQRARLRRGMAGRVIWATARCTNPVGPQSPMAAITGQPIQAPTYA
jgi:hypothetical protein